ncbi:hypothetical protein C7405_101681 [Paraburkholderia caballeronis]|uniref:hypothetical protein n=1 Tax=Paraburkholderia caballeronis TaxID=416943 RepID=UPI0010669DB2|nr:hypothetical protein [Paraburkholderia caballeronis]TDV39562.1 hypothetical protein C7405_101681 [Paraburkholderia caballeronis]
MSLINLDLRHVRTGVHLTRAELADSAYEALCARTARRQREAKASLEHRGVAPRVQIGSLYVAPRIAKHFQHSDSVGGVL